MKRLLYLLLVLALVAPNSWGQSAKQHISTVPPSLQPSFHPHLLQKRLHDRCGFMRHNRFDTEEKKAWLQQWEKVLQKKMQERKRQRTEDVVYVVPIIVHVIHNGEPVGEGANISAEQVYSQIDVLNEDFRALNADLSDTRSQFIGLAGDTRVIFAPALEDPDGNILEEPGIQRYNGGRTGWDIGSFDAEVKPATQFDPYRYANFWTASLSGGLLGYAQFPSSPSVPGLPAAGVPTDEVSDGVVMGYQFFGSIDKVNTPQLQQGAPFNLGRTATHEIGHWLGLFHIWGDGDCNVDDEVGDTPNQGSPSSGCPSESQSSCGSVDMWENFMDYTDDNCMSLFTQGQVDRMRTVLELDDMRQQLMQSDVPVLGSNTFNSSATQACVGSAVEFRALLAEGFSIVGWEFEGGSPATSTDENVTVTYPAAGSYDVTLTVRGGDNDTTIAIERPDFIQILSLDNSVSLPISSGFESGLEEGWANVPGGWQEAPVGFNSEQSIAIDHFDRDFSETQTLALPIADLRNTNEGAIFKFMLAYPDGATATDALDLGYINPCSGAYTSLWRASGSELSTVTGHAGGRFEPSSDSDWREVTINILDISEVDYAQFIFRSQSNNGNIIYIDNVSLEEAKGAIPSFNIQPNQIVCPGFPLQFQNTTSFFGNPSDITWNWEFEGGIPATSNEQDPSGIVFANPGQYDVSLSVTIGGETYSTVFEEAITILDVAAQPTFLEETLDAAEPEILDNPLWAFEGDWLYAPDPLGLAIDNYNNDYTGVDITAALPNISFQGNENALLSFDVAYSGFSFQGTDVYDNLAILYSTDCGETFTTLTVVAGEDLATAEADSGPFVPSPSQWKEVSFPIYEINNDGSLEGIRFAIKVIGNYGNIIWFDNIRAETFPSAAPIADFYAVPYSQPEDEGSVLQGTEVAFEDESRLNPQFWTWSFEGATPAISNERNPKVVYEKPGVYNVSLTVSNAFGTGTRTKSSYLVVTGQESGATATLDNTVDNEVIDASDGFGYISGNNNYNDAAVAEFFNDPSPFSKLTQIEIGFAAATPNIDGNGESVVTINLWANNNGEPGDIFATTTIPFADAVASANDGSLAVATFAEDVRVNGSFFIGVDLPYNGEERPEGYTGDILALRTDEVESNTAWTLLGSDNSWLPFDDADNWGATASRSLWIFPTLESELITGLNGSRLSEAIQIFPNPSQGIFQFNAQGVKLLEYQAVDMLGKVVRGGKVEGNSLNLSGMPTGMYFLRLQTTQGTALKKVVIE